jgi:hypothetical protein
MVPFQWCIMKDRTQQEPFVFYHQTCVDLALLLVQGHLNQTHAYGI